jgi:HK97 family phage prohead protease
MELERRTFTTEIRAAAEGRQLSGYAAVFNSRSQDLGGFVEVIRPGAFARALDMDVRALWNHDSNHVLGRTKNGTLRLREDEHGLYMEVDLPDTAMGRDVHEMVRRGDVDQMSFAFSVNKGGEEWRKEDGQQVRELLDVALYDVSPVTYPAYEATTVSARALAMLSDLTQADDDAADAGAGDDAEAAEREALEARRARARLRLDLAAKQILGDDER